MIAVYYSSRNVQVQSDFYTFEGPGLIKDTFKKKHGFGSFTVWLPPPVFEAGKRVTVE